MTTETKYTLAWWILGGVIMTCALKGKNHEVIDLEKCTKEFSQQFNQSEARQMCYMLKEVHAK